MKKILSLVLLGLILTSAGCATHQGRSISSTEDGKSCDSSVKRTDFLAESVK